MKLKYMLRGIGIGAILMAVIMYFGYGKSKNTLSDDEIKTRARELGMMTVSEFQDKELNSLKDQIPELSKIKVEEKVDSSEYKEIANSPLEGTKSTPSNKGEETKQSSNEGDKTTKITDKSTTVDETAESKDKESGKQGETPTKSAVTQIAGNENSKADKTSATNDGNTETGDSETGKAKEQRVEVKTDTKLTFYVSKGMSSETVAASLKALGIIDDSKKFNKFLVDNGYASRIRVGSFELKKGLSYVDIATKLVK